MHDDEQHEVQDAAGPTHDAGPGVGDDKATDAEAVDDAPELTDDQQHALHVTPDDALPKVEIDIYVRAHGKLKPDQLAGFAAWARSTGKGRQTIPDWDVLHDEFILRAV